jgi:hypothetical protein
MFCYPTLMFVTVLLFGRYVYYYSYGRPGGPLNLGKEPELKLKNGLLHRVIPLRTACISVKMAEKGSPRSRSGSALHFPLSKHAISIIAVFRIRMILGLPDPHPNPLVTSMDPTPDPYPYLFS